MTTHRILHLGAGIQSSTIYMLMTDREIEPADYALFADTQEEPAWVYEQVNWLRSHSTIPIIEVTAGKIGDDLINGRHSTGQRFASIPAHTTYQEGKRGGKTRRQCTREYKIEPIERWIRRDLLSLAPKQRIPKGVLIMSLFGFSTDEPGRAVRMRVHYDKKPQAWQCAFPLFDDDILMTKQDCKNYIEERSGFEWRSSRCVFCPLQSNRHFAEIKDHDSQGWQRAIEVDKRLRTTGTVANRDMRESMYIHRNCIPLDKAKLDGDQLTFLEDDGCDDGCFL